MLFSRENLWASRFYSELSDLWRCSAPMKSLMNAEVGIHSPSFCSLIFICLSVFLSPKSASVNTIRLYKQWTKVCLLNIKTQTHLLEVHVVLHRLGCGQSPVFLSGSPLFWFC